MKNTKYGRKSLQGRPLNKFGRWVVARGMTTEAIATALGVSTGHAWSYILPIDHPRFAVPRPPVMARIVDLTERALQPNDFYVLPEMAA